MHSEGCDYGYKIECGTASRSYELSEDGLLVSLIETNDGDVEAAVCDDGFDNTVAGVVCKNIGYLAHHSWSRNYQFYGIGCGSEGCSPNSVDM